MATLRRIPPQEERGQAIVELALTLPLLLLIIMGVFDFGLLFQRFEVVTNAAREGARLAVLTSEYSTAEARQRALDYLAAGGVAGTVRTGSCSVAPTANTICVEVTPQTTTITGTSPAVTVDEMVVTVEYDHRHAFVGPIMRLFGGSLDVTPVRSTSRMRVE
jgi:Flp pilus assembly protein TadG